MGRMPRLAALCAIALGLSACSGGGEPPEPSTVEETRTSADVSYVRIAGDSVPDSIVVMCVEGSAFLYVYASETNFRQGGPALSRFPEQDKTCDRKQTQG
jgi:hypothetical protein